MRKTRLAGVQQHYVRAREILDGTLCLWSPVSPTKRNYRAILEIAPINFLLKSADWTGRTHRALSRAARSPSRFPWRCLSATSAWTWSPIWSAYARGASSFRRAYRACGESWPTIWSGCCDSLEVGAR